MRKKRSGEDFLLYLNTGGARSLEGKRRDPCFSNECKKSIDRKRTKCYNHLRCRGIAQFGSALGSGPRGRRFKSCCSDHLCGCSSMVERQPSKLVTRVRFPSPAPFFIRSVSGFFIGRKGRVTGDLNTTFGYRRLPKSAQSAAPLSLPRMGNAIKLRKSLAT